MYFYWNGWCYNAIICKGYLKQLWRRKTQGKGSILPWTMKNTPRFTAPGLHFSSLFDFTQTNARPSGRDSWTSTIKFRGSGVRRQRTGGTGGLWFIANSGDKWQLKWNCSSKNTKDRWGIFSKVGKSHSEQEKGSS